MSYPARAEGLVNSTSNNIRLLHIFGRAAALSIKFFIARNEIVELSLNPGHVCISLCANVLGKDINAYVLHKLWVNITVNWLLCICVTSCTWWKSWASACSIAIIVIGNEISNPSSNPGKGCLHFTFTLMHSRKV